MLNVIKLQNHVLLRIIKSIKILLKNSTVAEISTKSTLH